MPTNVEDRVDAPQKKRPISGEVYKTASQRAAYDRLVELHRINPDSFYANISPRTRAILITGPAGSGKTAVVRAFSRMSRLPMLSLLGASWIPTGANQPSTLHAVRDFVRLHQKGLIYIDEVDKLTPAGAQVRQSPWALSTFGEALSLVDFDARLVSLGWTNQDVERFRLGYRIIASGAWQHVDARVRHENSRGALGFGSKSDLAPTYSAALAEDDAVPEELRYRFFAETLHVSHPTREDFREGLRQIHEALDYIEDPITERLLDEAEQSRLGLRWLESYLARILLRCPELQRRADDDVPHHPSEAPARQLSRDEYAVVHEKLSGWIISLRQALGRFEVACTLALDRPETPEAVADLVQNGWQEHPSLREASWQLGEALVPLETAHLDTNRAYRHLMTFSFVAKWAIRKHTPGLSKAGLLHQAVAVYELSDRIETVMKSLIGVAVQ